MKRKIETYQYFKIAKERQDYKGNRFFKVDVRFGADTVLQVCTNVGECKKGKANNFGIYLISRMTFFANYLSMGYAIPCTKKEYENQFNETLKYLS